MNATWTWLTLALLGAYHGINPAMGWLFAVALGLQERRRSAVVRAFVPIALGHAVSVGAVVALIIAAQALVAPQVLRIAGGGALLAFGLYKWLAPAAHPRWVGMRVGFRDLSAWSFLMSTAHGAGLMLVPLVMRLAGDTTVQAHTAHDHAVLGAHATHVVAASIVAAPGAQLVAVVIHTLAMFLVMSVVAVVVYQYVGLAILRRTWFNLDRMWATALIGAGVLTFIT